MKLYTISVLVGLTIAGVHAQDAIDVIPPATIPAADGAKTPATAPNLVKPKPNRANAKKAAKAKAAKAQAAKGEAQATVLPAAIAPVAVAPAPIPSVTPVPAAVPAIPDFGPAPAPVAAAPAAPAAKAPVAPKVAVTERIVKSTTQGNTSRDTTLPLINTTGGGEPFSLRKNMAIASTIEIPLAETIPIGGPPPPKEIETTTAVPAAIGTEAVAVEVSKVSNERIANQLVQTTRGLPVSVETDQNSAVIRIGVIKTEPLPSRKPFIVESVPVPGSLGPSTGPGSIPIAKTIPLDEEPPVITATESTPAVDPVRTVDSDPVAPPPGIEIDELAAEALLETIPAEPVIPATAEIEETVAPPVAEVEGASEWRSIGETATPAVEGPTASIEETSAIIPPSAIAPPATIATIATPATPATITPTTLEPDAVAAPSASGIPAGIAVKRGWNPFRPKKKVIVPATDVEVPEAAVKKQASGLFRKRLN